MVLETINYIIIFLFIFSLLSIIRLITNFLRALLSNPPKKFELDRSALIYYGTCISFIITILIKNTL
jgi:hypothetical protein